MTGFLAGCAGPQHRITGKTFRLTFAKVLRDHADASATTPWPENH
jgi:hypothetical protein